MAKFENNLTEGSVSKNLISFSLPFLLSNFIQSIYSMADLFIVAKFNDSASITGVNLGSQLTMLVTNLVFGLVTGGTILIAQYLGAKRRKDMHETIGTMFTLMLILGVAFTVILLLLKDVLLHAIDTPAEAYAEASNYLTICTCGIIFIFGYNCISAVLRGMGDSKNPLKFVAISACVNVVLDLILVGLLGMKASGAALATIMSQALSMVISITYLIRSKFEFDFKPSSFKLHKDKIKQLLVIGLPTSLQNSISSISFLTLTTLINGYGVYAAAGAGVVGKINNFAVMPAIAMSSSIAAMSGQNIGAGMHDRALRTMKVGRNIALGISLLIFAIIQIFPEQLLMVFTDEAEAIAYGVAYVRGFSLDYLIVPFTFCATGLITGSGNTIFVAVISILCSLVLRIPVAQFLSGPMGLGLVGVGLAVPAGSLGNYILAAGFIATGRWKKSKIVQQEVPDGV